jgi:hypothetical protein
MTTSQNLATIKNPWGDEMNRFLDGYFYAPEAFLLDEIVLADAEAGVIEAKSSAGSKWLVSPYQRGEEKTHPRHISAADLLMLTASLGSLHAYFFHRCFWHEGWVGFGNRIEKAQFHALALISKPLSMRSKEVRVRRRGKRTLLEFEFEFSQGGEIIYTSRQMAMFLKQKSQTGPE